jgi:hypothetical protein
MLTGVVAVDVVDEAIGISTPHRSQDRIDPGKTVS